MRAKVNESYIRSFLIDALLSMKPLKDAIILMDLLTPSVYAELVAMDCNADSYTIKKAFSTVLLRRLSADGEKLR